MEALNNYKPERVLYYFEEICKIPHGSSNTKQISDYLVSFARSHDLKHMQDDWNNVLIKKTRYSGVRESTNDHLARSYGYGMCKRSQSDT